MDAYTKTAGGSDIIRAGQQWLNLKYNQRAQFSIIPYRKLGRRDDEIAVLKRWLALCRSRMPLSNQQKSERCRDTRWGSWTRLVKRKRWLLTGAHRVPATAALPLFPVGEEKSPGPPQIRGSRGSISGGTGGI